MQFCPPIGVLRKLPLRQSTGMLAGLDWPVPDFPTLCRRQNAPGHRRAACQRPHPAPSDRSSGTPPRSCHAMEWQALVSGNLYKSAPSRAQSEISRRSLSRCKDMPPGSRGARGHIDSGIRSRPQFRTRYPCALATRSVQQSRTGPRDCIRMNCASLEQMLPVGSDRSLRCLLVMKGREPSSK